MNNAHTFAHMPAHVPITVVHRGGHPELVHYGSVAVVNAQGTLLAHAGDISAPMFTRSALKPFQAMPLIARHADRYRLTPRETALLCASHNGADEHTEGVTNLLTRAGASPAHLACGSHVPYLFAATGRVPGSDQRFTPLHHNCSGKHTGMLMLAAAEGWPLTGYLDATHPAQQAIQASVTHFTGVGADALVMGVDGCSAPNFAVPLPALARAFARLTLTEPDPLYGDGPRRIATAMAQHPDMVSGQGRSDLVLTHAGRGDWVCKVGADGVQTLASRSRGVALAAKVSDGNLKALMVAVVSMLDKLGWLDDEARTALAEFTPPPMKNAAGLDVGQMVPVVKASHCG